jgi:hypothetical protein
MGGIFFAAIAVIPTFEILWLTTYTSKKASGSISCTMSRFAKG